MKRTEGLKRKPPKWIERVVYISVLPGDRQEQIIDLRRRFRRELRKDKSGKSAVRLARREALYWLCWVWPNRLFFLARLVRKFTAGA